LQAAIKNIKLFEGYTGAAHQDICRLNNNVGCEGAAHRDIFWCIANHEPVCRFLKLYL
jgi:hypothetical protein